MHEENKKQMGYVWSVISLEEWVSDRLSPPHIVFRWLQLEMLQLLFG